jgi:hypothetical protein
LVGSVLLPQITRPACWPDAVGDIVSFVVACQSESFVFCSSRFWTPDWSLDNSPCSVLSVSSPFPTLMPALLRFLMSVQRHSSIAVPSNSSFAGTRLNASNSAVTAGLPALPRSA